MLHIYLIDVLVVTVYLYLNNIFIKLKCLLLTDIIIQQNYNILRITKIAVSSRNIKKIFS